MKKHSKSYYVPVIWRQVNVKITVKHSKSYYVPVVWRFNSVNSSHVIDSGSITNSNTTEI